MYHHVAERVHLRAVVGVHDDGGDRRLDDGRTGESGAGRQALEVVDLGGDEVSVFLEVGVPRPLARRRGIARRGFAPVNRRPGQLADGRDAQRQHLPARLRVPGSLPVGLLVEIVEPGVELLQVIVSHRLPPRHRHVDLVDLVAVAHVHAAQDLGAAVPETGGREVGGGAGAQRVEAGVEADRVQRRHHVVRHAVLVGHVRGDQPGGRVHRGRQGNDHLAHAELMRAARGVGGRGAADGHHGELPRVLPPLHRAAADEIAHVGVDDPEDAAGGLRHGHPQRPGDALLDGGHGRLLPEGETAPQKVVGVQIPQGHVGVAHRRLAPADAVGHRTRGGARPLGPDLEQAGSAVDPGDAAAARADGGHPDLGRQDAVALEHRLVVALDDAVPHQADLEGGAAHVRRQHVGLADQVADEPAAHHPGRGSGLQGADGPLGGGFDAEHAAVGLHHQGVARKPPVREALLKVAQIGSDPGADVGVEDGRGGALVLAQERRHVARAAHVDAGMPAPDHLGHRLLVGVVGDGPQKAHRHRFHPLGHEAPHHLLDLFLVGFDQHRPLVVDAPPHLPGQAPRRQRLRLHQARDVRGLRLRETVGHIAPHHQERVREALGGHQPGARAGAGDEGVVGDRARVKEKAGRAEQLVNGRKPEIGGPVREGVDDALGEVVGRRQRLADGQLAVAVQDDAIRAGAADVDADDVVHFRVSVPSSLSDLRCGAPQDVL